MLFRSLILTMQPSEKTANYRRYFLNALPKNCCNIPGNPTTAQVETLVKLEFIPAIIGTDYLSIPNLEAIGCEAKSVRYEGMDNPNAEAMAMRFHKQAIGYLQGDLIHYEGTKKPAIAFAPFGSANFNRITGGFF